MIEIVEAITAGILHYLPTLLGIAVGYLWNKARGLSKKRDAVEAAMRVILKINLLSIYETAVRDGHITIETEGIAEEVYEHYHALGGNGQGTKIIADIRKLLPPEARRKV